LCGEDVRSDRRKAAPMSRLPCQTPSSSSNEPIRGMNDVLPADIGAWQRLEAATREIVFAASPGLSDSVSAVAAGWGGHQAGEVASDTALEPIRRLDGRRFPSAKDLQDALTDAITTACQRHLDTAAVAVDPFAFENAPPALPYGAGLNARGAMEIIIATVGLQLGILSQQMFTVVVVMAIVTSLETLTLISARVQIFVVSGCMPLLAPLSLCRRQPR
jgi:hypothetical protein